MTMSKGAGTIKKARMEVWSASRALLNKQKPVLVKRDKHGAVTVQASKIITSNSTGRLRRSRNMPPEYYLLSETTRRNVAKRLTARQLYYCMSYLAEGVHWKGRIPETEYWLMEVGLRLLCRLRDSERPQDNERFRHLQKMYVTSGGYAWSCTASGAFRVKRQHGWSTHKQIVRELKNAQASGALYWPETYEPSDCPDCGSVRCVDACTMVLYCWNRSCFKSRWNTARTGTGITSFTQAKGSLIQGKNILRNAPRKRSEPEAAGVGQQLLDMVQKGGPKALELLKNKRV